MTRISRLGRAHAWEKRGRAIRHADSGFFFRSILPPELAEFFRIMSIFGRKRVSLKWGEMGFYLVKIYF